MLRLFIAGVALSVFVVDVHAQQSAYYVVPTHNDVYVYRYAREGATVIDILNVNAVLIPLDDPRDTTLTFIQVEPAREFVGHVRWSMGYVRRTDIAFQTDRRGHVSTSRPLPRNRFHFGGTVNTIETAPVDFRPGTYWQVEEIFGAGGSDAMYGGFIAWQRGAPTNINRASIGTIIQVDLGVSPDAGIFNLAVVGGPSVGIQIGRVMGVHASARGGASYNNAYRRNGDRRSSSSEEHLHVFTFGAIGQVMGGMTVGSVSQIKLEVGHQFAYLGGWAYSSSEDEGLFSADFDSSPVSMTGPIVRIAYSIPIRFSSPTPSEN
jgi:hypothetical protein